jgi:LysM repeat protein
MAARSPARFLAPLALVAVAVALWMIVGHSSSDSGSGSSGTSATEQQATATPTATRKKKPKHPRFYTVKPGDTPSGIAEKTGVPLTTIEELNPELDPQALSPGTKLKLRG